MSDAATLSIVAAPDGVVVAGEIDASTASHFATALDPLPAQVTIIDLRRVSFMDSSGLRVLVDAAARARDAGGGVVLREPTTAIRRLLEVTGLTELLPIESC